jgi:hypothetical protein
LKAKDNDIFAFIKPSHDAHSMGINAAIELLHECGYHRVVLANDSISDALSQFRFESGRKNLVNWIKNNKFNYIGISYRLDQDEALDMIRFLVKELQDNKMLVYQGGFIKAIFFGALIKACQVIDKEYGGLVVTFKGGESIHETLLKMQIPENKIPVYLFEGSSYDETRLKFGKEVIDSQEYKNIPAIDRSGYSEYGTFNDSIVKRIIYNNNKSLLPLIRAHVGPYSAAEDRFESINMFISWIKELARDGYLDILSIGTSQLTQSNFNEDWNGKSNGGGVPINSPEEFSMVWREARPMLVRAYAGTKNIPEMAKMFEKTINICWHALSLWWFNKLDERGPYDLYTNLQQHISTLQYIAKTNKPFEPNVSHHFAFRGADDVTYIVSVYLAAKLAKIGGIKTLVLQNMLNTPRSTWGIQDLAKSRAMLHIIKQLEDSNFTVIFQPRAGLDYFSSDLEEAKIQLASVTALMDDIESYNEKSPSIIHVVSYSEASHLATPDVINESIQITLKALQRYRQLKKAEKIEDMDRNKDIENRMYELIDASKTMIDAIEALIDNLYSADGLYKTFASGFLPTPYLWKEKEEFKYACTFKSKIINGGVKIINDNGNIVSTNKIIEFAKYNLKEIEYNLMQNKQFNTAKNSIKIYEKYEKYI